MSKKYVYLFKEGNADMRELLGGKGANLAEMTNLGLPIPQGFTVSTEACTEYYNDGKKINDEIQSQIFEALKKLEENRYLIIEKGHSKDGKFLYNYIVYEKQYTQKVHAEQPYMDN